MRNIISDFKKLNKLEQGVFGGMITLTIAAAICTTLAWYHLIVIR